MGLTTSPIQLMRTTAEILTDRARQGERYCMQLLDNDQMMHHIRETGYEFAIMDLIGGPACYFTIPYSLGIPYATMSLDLTSAHLFRVPRISSFPNIFSLSNQPTFLQRLEAFIVGRTDFLQDNRNYMEKYVTNRPHLDMLEIFRRQSLWLLLEDSSVNYPLPHMPNTIAVGDIMSRAQERPLSDELKEFISRSINGVILVSLGRFYDLLPPAISQRLCEAFTEAVKRFGVSIIWKLNAEGLRVLSK